MNTTAGPADIPHVPGEPESGGSPALLPASVPFLRVLSWSMRRELWETRSVYLAPSIVAGVILLGFAIGAIRAPLAITAASFGFSSGALMLTYLIVAVIYCLEALYGERRDRSILFWKSLPVSDVGVVAAKATVPLLILPLITFVLTVLTQLVMLLIASAVLEGAGGSVSALWTMFPVLRIWTALLYHLITVHTLYYAPIYGWLLLVSAWARRAPFLWATLPVAAVLIIEKLVFNTSVLAKLLLSRLAGGPAAIPFHMGIVPPSLPTLPDIGEFLASPGLWIGFALCAAFLTAAARLRRYQGPI